MTQTVALIVHELLDAPNRWKETKRGTVSNGYYSVDLTGTSYGMGEATYQSTSGEREVLLKAIDDWKDETGWKPHEPAEAPEPKEEVKPHLDYTQSLAFHEEFAKAVRSSHRSYMVHNDATLLSTQISNAIQKLDNILRPVTMVEAKRG